MVKLNDYLYNGDTVLKILQRYSADLKESAVATHDLVDLEHVNYLLKISELLQHNDFLTSQSQRLREFYKYMADAYPFLAFTFKGRIKSLIRAEEKFNGNEVKYMQDVYRETGDFPPTRGIIALLQDYHDLIAYRIVISMPACHLKEGEDREETELRYLYEIAEALPAFLEERGFSPQLAPGMKDELADSRRAAAFRTESCNSGGVSGQPAETAEGSPVSGQPAETAKDSPVSGQQTEAAESRLSADIRPYYKDYVAAPKEDGYRSLHIAFYDNIARCSIEVQLRTKDMDDHAEIGAANHTFYEGLQSDARTRTDAVPTGASRTFDEALERVRALQDLDLSKVDVNMFKAVNNTLVNDGCGLYRGRLILPYEHLSRFQNDLIG